MPLPTVVAFSLRLPWFDIVPTHVNPIDKETRSSDVSIITLAELMKSLPLDKKRDKSLVERPFRGGVRKRFGELTVAATEAPTLL